MLLTKIDNGRRQYRFDKTAPLLLGDPDATGEIEIVQYHQPPGTSALSGGVHGGLLIGVAGCAKLVAALEFCLTFGGPARVFEHAKRDVYVCPEAGSIRVYGTERYAQATCDETGSSYAATAPAHVWAQIAKDLEALGNGCRFADLDWGDLEALAARTAMLDTFADRGTLSESLARARPLT